MAVPNFYNDEFISRTLPAGFVDIQDWLDFIVNALTVELPVDQRWALVAADTYESPADPDTGYTWRIKLVRSSATEMLVTIYDQDNQVVQAGGAIIDGLGNDSAFISCGPKHIVTFQGVEFIIGWMVDPAPEAPNAPSIQVYSKIKRNASFGTIAFIDIPDRCFARDALAGSSFSRMQGPWFIQNSGTFELITAGGSALFYPAASIMTNDGVGQNCRFTGTPYQFAWFDRAFASGRVAMPIDVGVVGYFMIIPGLLKAGGAFANQAEAYLAVRVE